MNIVVLTGAGISKSAGLPTYRGPGGLWNDPRAVELNHVSALASRRVEVCAMFWKLYRAIDTVQPTAAHRALAELEARANVAIITQNVDGLHQAAGSTSVCEYHGSLARWRCERCGTERVRPDEPACCGEPMRPGVVLFGEEIPAAADHAAKRALRNCELFVAIGTSGTVYPAAGFVRAASYAGAHTVLLNLEVDDEAREAYAEVHTGPADELVPGYFR
jgi:NAD-dependent deacetylase